MNSLKVHKFLVLACYFAAVLSMKVAAGELQSNPMASLSAPQRWTPDELSTDEYESSPTFSPDGREMFFMRANRSFQNFRLLWTRCHGGKWSQPVPPPFAAPAPIADADPFYAPDGKRVYFVSTRHNFSKTGNEDFDIYFVERKRDGNWGAAQRLPEPINSSASELLPRLDANGVLYFGSSRAGGYGQSDIYSARHDKNGNWRLANVGPPVSTPANEYEAEISRDGRTMVVVADRGDRSRLYIFDQTSTGWLERGMVPGDPAVFQVGPLLSPSADRLIFAQSSGVKSGELFLVNLKPRPSLTWPPICDAPQALNTAR